MPSRPVLPEPQEDPPSLLREEVRQVGRSRHDHGGHQRSHEKASMGEGLFYGGQELLIQMLLEDLVDILHVNSAVLVIAQNRLAHLRASAPGSIQLLFGA